MVKSMQPQYITLEHPDTLLMIELHIRELRSNIALWDVVNMPNCYEQMSTRNFSYLTGLCRPQPLNGENARIAIIMKDL